MNRHIRVRGGGVHTIEAVIGLRQDLYIYVRSAPQGAAKKWIALRCKPLHKFMPVTDAMPLVGFVWSPVRPVLHDVVIALSNLCARRDGTRVRYAACKTGSRYLSPLVINAQTIRA